MIELNKIYEEDGLTGMSRIPDAFVDLILCDLPQGKTKNKWDVILPFAPLWEQYLRVIKPNGAIVLFANQPFTSLLVMSMSKLFRYSLVWHKKSPSGFLNAKKMPLRAHEDICVFYKKKPLYVPQKTKGHPRKVSTAAHKKGCLKTDNYGAHSLTSYDSTERYPTSVLAIKQDKQQSAIHPTQKPVALNAHFILTHTLENAICLDNCSGSGSMPIACLETGRNFICFENNAKHHSDSIRRIEAFKNTRYNK